MLFPRTFDSLTEARRKMVESQLRKRGIRDERVLAAMSAVPREEFALGENRARAYEDCPLPIGEGQTISQPFVAALMLEALALKSTDIVLEVGTGSGYQTALLAGLSAHVYSVERRSVLAKRAEDTLSRLGYGNVSVMVTDGSLGLPEKQPFDGIVVAAAAPRVPPALFEQLREGARMVVPVGAATSQELQLVRKQAGRAEVTALGRCAFVPLIGHEGQFPD